MNSLVPKGLVTIGCGAALVYLPNLIGMIGTPIPSSIVGLNDGLYEVDSILAICAYGIGVGQLIVGLLSEKTSNIPKMETVEQPLPPNPVAVIPLPDEAAELVRAIKENIVAYGPIPEGTLTEADYTRKAIGDTYVWDTLWAWRQIPEPMRTEQIPTLIEQLKVIEAAAKRLLVEKVQATETKLAENGAFLQERLQ